MRILIDLIHPAHVHFYRHAIREWRALGHEVLLTARDKDVTLALLAHYRLDHEVLSVAGRGVTGLGAEFAQREWRLWRAIRAFQPDVATAIGGTFIAPVCKLAGVPAVVFTDSEHASFERRLTHRLAAVVCTPHCFKGQAGPRQVRYRGFQELAYLHPNYFTPNPSPLAELGLAPGDRFALLRFVAWGAGHDIGQSGFTAGEKTRLVRELAQWGRVLVSAEGALPREFAPYALTAAPETIHDLLHYASLYAGEGATMATEAGLLGTPSVYVSSLAGTMGNFDELGRFGLVEAFQDGATGVQRAIALIDDPQAKAKRQEARRQMLDEMGDVSAFLMHAVESAARRQEIA